MKKLSLLLVSLGAAFSLLAAHAVAGGQPADECENLKEQFAAPPDAARPYAYWYWINGHITAKGITADLEGMKHAGLGGVVIFNIGRTFPPGPIRIATPEWRELMKHAVREAARLGLKVNLNNSSGGWSGSGGPWITPELAMQKLTWSETHVHGSNRCEVDLARPPVLKTYQPEFFDPPKKLDWYRDIAVLAFPTPPMETWQGAAPRITANDPQFDPTKMIDADGKTWSNLAVSAHESTFVQFAYDTPFSGHSLSIYFRSGGAAVPGGELSVSDDGRQWRKVRTFSVREEMPVNVPFDAPPARFWKITFSTKAATGAVRLAKVSLLPGYRIEDWSGKAMFDHFGLDKPVPPPSSATAPAGAIIRRDQIVDLTSHMDETGRLTWDAPPGDWTIIRFGYTPTGQITGSTPARGGAGLEGDKFNTAALDVHWAHALKPFFDDPEINAHVQYIHNDSWELGAQNWSGRFPAQFQQRCGYDLRSYLPVMTGRVVDSLDVSERFLWDLRHVICGLIVNNYFGYLHNLCHQHGKLLSLEAYHQDQFDTVTAGGRADIPMAEVWMGVNAPGPYWPKLGASPGHVYGKKIIQCESFTSNLVGNDGGNWSKAPWDLKTRGDLIFCGGINRMVLHVSALQPWFGVAPGMTVGSCGQHVDRGNTWWDKAYGWTRYLARCQHLLQQGMFVADVLYSCGENSPSKSLLPSGAMQLPSGYDYDVCDPEVILTRLTVKDGRLVLPDGMSYRLLVLPEGDTMTPALLRKIGDLVEAGATVVGRAPTRAPGLVGFPSADAEIGKLAKAVWGDCGGTQVKEHSFGKGRVISDTHIAPILAGLGLQPDFTAPSRATFRYIHRRLDGGDLYFVASASDRSQTGEFSFRVRGKQPELWDPLTGAIRALPAFRFDSDRTIVPLEFAPRQSFFVVFGKGVTSQPKSAAANFAQLKPVAEMGGPWDVAFDPKWGGPSHVTFDKLEDWTKRPETGIKFYSGSAIYRKTFDFPGKLPAAGSPLFLDLGKVKNLAEVRLNGKNLGVVWCAPWHVEITDTVKPTGNQLEIQVVNLWPNRMIGDEQLPADDERGAFGIVKALPKWLTENQPRTSGRFTFATCNPWHKTDPLLESGLLGPVTLRIAK